MEIVSFEIAKKLKEKGFNEKCYTFYEYNSKEFYREESIPCCNSYSDDYAAPTISQVLKWLREKKLISVEPCATPYNCWYYIIKCKGEIKVTYTYNKYRTYEEAALAGIEYVIDNLL